MATQLQLRRGTTAENAAFTGAVGEVTVDTDKHTLLVHDGSTAGGARELGKAVKVTFSGDVSGKLENFDVSKDVTVSLSVPRLTQLATDVASAVSAATAAQEAVANIGSGSGGSGSGSGEGQSFQWYKSDDSMFGYFGSKAGATCVFAQDAITVTLPAGCTVLSMYICQDEEYITKAQCTINFDSTHVMTEDGVTFDVEDLTTLCHIMPFVQVFKLASNGLQDYRAGMSQVNTGTNTIYMQGLPTGDARVFKLIF